MKYPSSIHARYAWVRSTASDDDARAWGRDGVSVVPGPIYPREYAGEETFGL